MGVLRCKSTPYSPLITYKTDEDDEGRLTCFCKGFAYTRKLTILLYNVSLKNALSHAAQNLTEKSSSNSKFVKGTLMDPGIWPLLSPERGSYENELF